MGESGRVWTRRPVAASELGQGATSGTQAGMFEAEKSPHLVDVSRQGESGIDPTDEELMEFLAADYEAVEADPEFKRKLRDQLWTLVQRNQLTRQ